MSANIGAAGNGEFIYEMEMMESGTTTANVVNEYVPIIPTFANLADVTTWSDVNSLTKTETLNSANAWYLVFKNAQSAWGANTELGVHQVTTGTYRKAVINTAGTWQYNSNATYGSETLTNATINTLAGAIRQALTVAANQMDSATLIQSMDASLSTPTGKAGIVPILYSTVNTNNPQVDQTRVNYDAQTSAMTFVSNPTIVEQIPSNMFITAIAEYTTGTPVYYLSRDNGTTWATATMTLKGTYSGTKKIYAGTADVSGQTSSSSLRYKITTTAGQDVKIYGAYVYGGDVSGGGGGSGVVSAGAQGQLAFYGTAGSALTATSSLFLSQAGNFGIGTTTPTLGPLVTNAGAYVTTGGVWTNASDVNMKENFTQMDSRSILDKIVALPVQKWNYKSESSSITHIGPTAQDFYTAFGVGNNNTSISTIDPAGIALLGLKAIGSAINLSSAPTTTPSLTINASGNVGIGTTSPATLLSVAGNGYFSGGLTASSLSLSNALSVGSGGTGWASVQSGAILYGAGSGALATTTQGTSGQVLSWLNGVPSWTATSTLFASLTIGATSTNNTLVFGTAAVLGGAFSGDLNLAHENYWTASQNFTGISTNQLTATSSVYLATLGGSVGIGTTSPWGQLSVNSYGIAGPSFVISSSTVTQFIVTNGGMVGIGTSTPNHALTVAGDIGATGFVNTSTREAKVDISYTTASSSEQMLNQLVNLKVATYRYKIEDQNDPLRLGFIAEEAQIVAPEVLSPDGKGVDLYKLATFTLSGVQALSAKVNAQNTRITSLETRLTALESGSIGTSSGTPTISTTTLASALNSFSVLIEKGIAQFNTLVFRTLVASKDADGTSSAGSVVVLTGNTVAQVSNSLVATSTKVFVTFNSQITGSWWVSDKVASSFRVILSAPQTTDVSFDYFLVQTEGQIATSSPMVSAGVTQSSGPDTTPPVITILGDNPVHISVGSPYTDPGVVITDAVDGTTPLVTFINGVQQEINATTINTSSPTTYIITYSATDRAGNSATVTRSVIVGTPPTVTTSTTPASPADTTPPVVTLIGSAVMQITVGSVFTDPGATATDNIDGTLAAVVTGSVDTATAGLYTLTYTATDIALNTASVSRVITVSAPAVP